MTSTIKKEWTVADTHKLIEDNENNPCLWNPKHPKYDDKLMKSEVLRQLAITFETSDGEIQRKLHGLRNQHAGETK